MAGLSSRSRDEDQRDPRRGTTDRQRTIRRERREQSKPQASVNARGHKEGEELDSLLHRAIGIDQVIASVSGSLLTRDPANCSKEALHPEVEQEIRIIQEKALESGDVLHEARRKHRLYREGSDPSKTLRL